MLIISEWAGPSASHSAVLNAFTATSEVCMFIPHLFTSEQLGTSKEQFVCLCMSLADPKAAFDRITDGKYGGQS